MWLYVRDTQSSFLARVGSGVRLPSGHQLNRRLQQTGSRGAAQRPGGVHVKAIVQDTYGDADVLRLDDIDVPVAGRGEVLLRVHAASLFVGDWHVMTGLPYAIRPKFGLRRPKAQVRGQDVAGRVEAVGEDVTGLRQGDDVFGTCQGSFAEYVSVPENLVALKPSNLTFEQAAVVPITGTTAAAGGP